MIPDLRPHLWTPVPWSGCWEWLGYAIDQKGNGELRARMFFEGKVRYAARVFYQHYKGPLPNGIMVCHVCDNPMCVNPWHMFLGTNADNMIDCLVKGRHNNASKTRCSNGHEFTAANTAHFGPDKKWRRCKKCDSEKNAIRYMRRMGKC